LSEVLIFGCFFCFSPVCLVLEGFFGFFFFFVKPSRFNKNPPPPRSVAPNFSRLVYNEDVKRGDSLRPPVFSVRVDAFRISHFPLPQRPPSSVLHCSAEHPQPKHETAWFPPPGLPINLSHGLHFLVPLLRITCDLRAGRGGFCFFFFFFFFFFFLGTFSNWIFFFYFPPRSAPHSLPHGYRPAFRVRVLSDFAVVIDSVLFFLLETIRATPSVHGSVGQSFRFVPLSPQFGCCISSEQFFQPFPGFVVHSDSPRVRTMCPRCWDTTPVTRQVGETKAILPAQLCHKGRTDLAKGAFDEFS